jgi:hypothetical protein
MTVYIQHWAHLAQANPISKGKVFSSFLVGGRTGDREDRI